MTTFPFEPLLRVGTKHRWQVLGSDLRGQGEILEAQRGPSGNEYRFETGWVAEKYIFTEEL